MKLLVFADSHGHPATMLHMMQQQQTADAAIFLGDGSRDCDAFSAAYPTLPLYRVAGNCDFGGLDPAEGLVAFGGVLFFYTHGHHYGVKSGLETLYQAAVARQAAVALFAHTHVPLHQQCNDIHLFNPGSLGCPRTGGKGTYGIITIQNKVAQFTWQEV